MGGRKKKKNRKLDTSVLQDVKGQGSGVRYRAGRGRVRDGQLGGGTRAHQVCPREMHQGNAVDGDGGVTGWWVSDTLICAERN